MIKKKTIGTIVVLLIFVLAFDTMALTGFAKYAKFLGIGAAGLGYGVFFFHYRSFPKALRHFGLMFAALLVSSVFSAYFVFNQPPVSGIIASSSLFIAGISFLVYYVLTKYRIDLERMRNNILKLSWGVFFAFAVIFFLGLQFESSSTDDYYSFQSLRKGVINLGALIYLVMFFKYGRNKYIFFSFLLFSMSHWDDFQRYLFLMYILCIGSMLVQYKNQSTGLKALAVILISAPVMVTALSYTDFGERLERKITNTLALFDSDEESLEDNSINARVFEAEYAATVIVKYPLTGVGKIRTADKKKITGMDYFYVSDIGLIGVAFSYGIFGLYIFFRQVKYVWREMRGEQLVREPLNAEFKLFLLFLIIHTILSGRTMDNPAQFMCIVALIEVGKFQAKLNQTESSEEA